MNQVQNIENTIKTNSESQLTTVHDIKIVTYVGLKNQLCAAIWKGRQSQAYARYRFRSEDQRTAYLEEQTLAAKGREDYKEEKKKEKKGFVPQVKVGDIFSSSWGYDQTNVSFYQVVEKPSKHFVVVKELVQEIVNVTGHMSQTVIGLKGEFRNNEEGCKMKVTKSGESEMIRFNSSESARIWDGKPKYSSSYA